MTQAYDNYYSEFQKNAELQQNLKYKKKYRRLKRIIKDTVFVRFLIYFCHNIFSFFYKNKLLF